MPTSIDWPRFVELIQSHERFVLTSHVRPDCDALGSELGMAGVLAALGKQARIVNPHPVPPNLAFIDPDKRITVIGRDVPKDALTDYDVLMVLDTSAWAQLGDMAEVVRTTKARKMVLDHHVSEDDLGAEAFKNVQAEATGRLVVEAAEQLGVPLTAEIATPLFAAVATDTGWFRFASTTPSTFEVGAGLVRAGARPDWIFRSLYEQETLARLLLRGRILVRTKTELGGRLIYTAALKEDFDETGALPVDTEDVINLTLAVAGTEVAVIFVYTPAGNYKISFRSRGRVDCNQLASQFGGGGHKAAAGATIAGPLAEAQAKVLDAVRKAMG
jgi:phosphoesterase RecJ-like protein